MPQVELGWPEMHPEKIPEAIRRKLAGNLECAHCGGLGYVKQFKTPRQCYDCSGYGFLSDGLSDHMKRWAEIQA